MKNTSKYLCVFAFISLSGCYSKTLLFESQTLSVTKDHSDDKNLAVPGDAKGKWCTSAKPIYNPDQKHIGMAEQAIFDAQGMGKTADFILDAKVYIDTNGCAHVEGKSAKIK